MSFNSKFIVLSDMVGYRHVYLYMAHQHKNVTCELHSESYYLYHFHWHHPHSQATIFSFLIIFLASTLSLHLSVLNTVYRVILTQHIEVTSKRVIQPKVGHC